MAPDTPLAVAADRWLAVHSALRRSPAFHATTTQRVRDYLVAYFGTRPVNSLTRGDLADYRTWLATHALSRQTQNHVLADCRCFFRWLEDEGTLVAAPLPRRFLPRVPEREPHPLCDADVALLTALPDPYGFVLRLAFATGLRWGELVRAETRAIASGAFVVGHAKSGRVRRVPIAPWFVPELVGRVGRLVPFAASGTFNRTVRRLSGVADFHVHRTRHTFGCQWLRYGGSLAALKEILGHQSVETTEFYAKLSDDMVAREAARVWLGRTT